VRSPYGYYCITVIRVCQEQFMCYTYSMMLFRVAVLIVLTAFPAQTPRDAQGQSPNSVKTNSNTNQTPATEPSPSILKKASEENQNQGGKIAPTNKEQSVQITSIPKVSVESKKDLYDKILVVATGLLVFVGGFQIYFLWRTIRAIQSQATAMMEADCALFVISWDDFIHINPEAPNGVLSHAVRWYVKNAGKSPGFVKEVASRFIVIKSLDDLPPEPEYPPPRVLSSESEPVLSGAFYERTIYAPIESTLSYTELEAEHRAKKCLLYAYGFVRYLDVYGREQETRFGLVYNSAPTLTRAVDRFRIAGPGAYNRYKYPKGKSQPN
jgi:hypothetical protein